MVFLCCGCIRPGTTCSRSGERWMSSSESSSESKLLFESTKEFDDCEKESLEMARLT